jgi:hypothetical protein
MLHVKVDSGYAFPHFTTQRTRRINHSPNYLAALFFSTAARVLAACVSQLVQAKNTVKQIRWRKTLQLQSFWV